MSEDQPMPPPPSGKDAKRQAKADAAADKARAKAERPLWKKKRVILPAIVLVVIIAAVAGSGGGTEPELVSENPEAQEAAEEAEEAAEAVEESEGDETEGEVAEGFGIGDTIAMGDLEHTLHSARFAEGDEFMTPEEGTRWLVVDVEVTNKSDESEPMSSMILWRLVDADNRSKDMTFTGDEQGSLDGELGAGRSMRGELAYVVGGDEERWELIFEPNFFGFGQGIYEFGADEVG